MKFTATTIKDIAKELNLSTSTVSRALRDSYEISEKTKKIVLEYAKKINYHPNPIALSLKERRTRSIGVIVGEIANSFFSQAINGIEDVAYDKGYNVMITQSHETFDREIINLNYLASRSIDGLLISVSTETKDFSLLKSLHERGMPIVFFDRIVDEITTHKVTVDNRESAYDATRHLIKRGYKQIAHLASAPTLSLTRERVEGYVKAFESFSRKHDPKMIKYCNHGGLIQKEVDEALNQLFKQKIKPDAIFTSSDKLTTGALRYLHAKKIKVPKEVALVGFSNSDLTELLSPPLTIVKQPAHEMGKVATQLLLDMIESKRPIKEFTTTRLKTDLIIRAST